jgi:hypothetical protein
MPPHNQVVAIRARSLANILCDLREARDDWHEACAAAEREEPDADDRASEADTRVDDLRDEFAERFHEATGLTWKQIEAAIQAAVL